MHDQVPAVGHDEEENLHGQADHTGWHHEHTERHQHAGHHQVDCHKAQEDDESHNECGLEFRQGKGRYQHAVGDLLDGINRRKMGRFHEHGNFLLTGLAAHKGPERLSRFSVSFERRQFPVQ